MRKDTLSNSLTNKLLDKDLATSSWEEEFPEAYKVLLEYRQDIEQSFREEIEKALRAFRKEIVGY